MVAALAQVSAAGRAEPGRAGRAASRRRGGSVVGAAGPAVHDRGRAGPPLRRRPARRHRGRRGGVTARAFALLPAQRRKALCAGAVTIDLDCTDVEVYGRRKQGVAYNYQGQRVGRPHVAAWAEAGLVLAADLMSGRTMCARSPGSCCAGRWPRCPPRSSPRSAQAVIDGCGCVPMPATSPPTSRWPRSRPAVTSPSPRNATRPPGAPTPPCPSRQWQPAKGMHGAFVAVLDYRPEGWPPETYTIVRRVRVDTADISADGRSRRRRTIPAEQLALALGGQLDHVWAVRFIVTNIPTGGHEQFDTAVDVEALVPPPHRHRGPLQRRQARRRLAASTLRPPAVNAAWMWAALLAVNLSVLLQALTGLDDTRPRALPTATPRTALRPRPRHPPRRPRRAAPATRTPDPAARSPRPAASTAHRSLTHPLQQRARPGTPRTQPDQVRFVSALTNRHRAPTNMIITRVRRSTHRLTRGSGSECRPFAGSERVGG